jgi:hypothetical protein
MSPPRAPEASSPEKIANFSYSPDGTIAQVTIPYNGATHPASARVYLMIDSGAVANTTLTLP